MRHPRVQGFCLSLTEAGREELERLEREAKAIFRRVIAGTERADVEILASPLRPDTTNSGTE